MHAARPSNAQPAWRHRWPKDLPLRIEFQAGKELFVRVVAMLSKLLMRFDPEQYRVYESAAGLATPFEHEHEHDSSGKQSYSQKILAKRSNRQGADRPAKFQISRNFQSAMSPLPVPK
jgi:hypothetical protein